MRRVLIFPLILLLLMSACNLDQSRPLISLDADESLIIAWVNQGNLMLWQTGDEQAHQIATGAVVRPFVAPDGQHIVFTRGPQGRTDTLWLVDSAGTSEQLLIGEGKPRGFRSGQFQVGDVGWYDDSTLYVNTLKGSGIDIQNNDDLYRVNIRTREVALILRAGEGGRFSFSPDKKHIAVASSGTYGRQDGRISVIEPLAQDGATNLLFYIGVATGSEAPFYPRLQWTADSQSVLTALPDPDLIYHDMGEADNIPPTRLWQFPIAHPSDRNLIGSVASSLFGLPLWSDDTSQVLYLRRTANSNDFSLVLASANGENAQDYQSGTAGTIEQAQWIPDSQQFIYALDNPGNVYVGQLDNEPQALSSEPVLAPLFVDGSAYVFLSPAETSGQFDFRFSRPAYASIKLVHVGEFIPVFDAVLVRTTGTSSDS